MSNNIDCSCEDLRALMEGDGVYIAREVFCSLHGYRTNCFILIKTLLKSFFIWTKVTSFNFFRLSPSVSDDWIILPIKYTYELYPIPYIILNKSSHFNQSFIEI